MASTREESPREPSTSSIPLHMAGLLTGNTIHVQGDAGDLHFSVQFDIHQQPKTPNNNQPYLLGTDPTESPQRSIPSIAELFSSITKTKILGHGLSDDDDPSATKNPSSSTTKPTTPVDKNPHPLEFPDLGPSDFDQTSKNCQILATQMDGCDVGHSNTITTRLRSGVISSVTYFPHRESAYASKSGDHGPKSWSRRLKSKRIRSTKRDVLLRVLRRHKFPVRPCNSYTFFVMTKWEMVKTSSFKETSKKLGEMWFQLPETEKKEFVKMALKDNARYRKQCMLLKRK